MSMIKYKVSEADYLQAMRLFSKLSARSIVIVLFGALILVALVILGSVDVRRFAIADLIWAAAVLLLYRYVLLPIFAWRDYKKYKAIHQEFELELFDEGLNMASSNGQWLVRWDQMLKWRKNDQFILIYPLPRLFYIVPKRFSEQGLDVQLLRQKLLQHLGKAV